MKANQTIQDMFSHFQIIDKKELFQIIDQTRSEKSLDKSLSYLWHSEKAHQYLTPNVKLADKCEDDAEKFRIEGNAFFRKKMLDKALKYYNLSILSAPHPSPLLTSAHSNTFNKEGQTSSCHVQSDSCNGRGGEQISSVSVKPGEEEYKSSLPSCESEYKISLQPGEGENKALALGYGNRSAVLFELEQYETCLSDIDLALRYGLAKTGHCKLAERKARCLMAMGNVRYAQEVLETALEQLEYLSLEKVDHEKAKKMLLYLIDQNKIAANRNCLTTCGSISDNPVPSDSSPIKNEQLLFMYNVPEPIKLVDPHPSIPALSNAVTMTFSTLQGRNLIANKHIHPGNVPSMWLFIMIDMHNYVKVVL